MREGIKSTQHIIDKKTLKIYRDYFKNLEKILLSRWRGIQKRCKYPHSASYKYYGGRGIKCKFKSFDEFFDYVLNELDILSGKEIENLQIDRIDNGGHYEPGNIQFITPVENCTKDRGILGRY